MFLKWVTPVFFTVPQQEDAKSIYKCPFHTDVGNPCEHLQMSISHWCGKSLWGNESLKVTCTCRRQNSQVALSALLSWSRSVPWTSPFTRILSFPTPSLGGPAPAFFSPFTRLFWHGSVDFLATLVTKNSLSKVFCTLIKIMKSKKDTCIFFVPCTPSDPERLPP